MLRVPSRFTYRLFFQPVLRAPPPPIFFQPPRENHFPALFRANIAAVKITNSCRGFYAFYACRVYTEKYIYIYIYIYIRRCDKTCFEQNFGILYRCDSVLEQGSVDPRIDLVWQRFCLVGFRFSILLVTCLIFFFPFFFFFLINSGKRLNWISI